MSDAIAVVQTVFTFGRNGGESAVKAGLQVYGNQPVDRLATNQGRKVGRTLLGNNVPDLLRTVADYMDQEKLSTLEELGERLSQLGES